MLWSEILKSGEYLQAKGELFDGEGYCCLGVLEHACGVEFHCVTTPGYANEWQDEYGASGVPGAEFMEDFETWVLDEAITETDVNAIERILEANDYLGDPTAGLRTEEENYANPSRVKDALAAMNDGGCSFNLIAQVIVDRGWDVMISR